MQDWVVARKNATPQKTAFVCEGKQISFEAFSLLVQQTCTALRLNAQIEPGEIAAVLMPSNLWHVATIFALMRLQAVYMPLNTRLVPGEMQDQIRSTGCRYVLCCRETEAQAAKLSDGSLKILSFDKTACVEVHSMQWIDSQVQTADDVVTSVDLNRPLAVIHTSGTSGKPKGAVLTAGNFFYSAMASAYRLGHLPNDRWLCVLPLYHVGGLSIIIRAVLYGISVDLQPRFDLDKVNQALDTPSITLVSLVPTMLYRLLETRTQWPESLRLILLGGAAASQELIARCGALGLPVATTYGLTEAASQVATMLPDEVRRKPGSVGKPLFGTIIRIVNKKGQTQAPGEIGEIVVNSPTVMQGYFKDPEATNKTLRFGELYTGDMGYLDADGDLWIVQRRSDIIISGGENIYPAEVERVLKQHPGIADVCVVGLDDAEWGQIAAAAVVVRTGSAVDETELIRFSREHLAGYKIPRIILKVETLPETASGKISRAAVKELFRT